MALLRTLCRGRPLGASRLEWRKSHSSDASLPSASNLNPNLFRFNRAAPKRRQRVRFAELQLSSNGGQSLGESLGATSVQVLCNCVCEASEAN